MELDKKLQNITIGLLLGDGCFEKKKDTIGIRLQIKQQSKAREYVEWLYSQFKGYCLSEVKFREDYKQYYFSTRYLREFQNLYSLFYKNGRKIIPSNIKDLLKSPLSLAIWYMDDGSLDYRPNDHYAFYLASNCFSVEESKKLQKVLFDNFGIKSNVYNNLCRGKRYPRIYIGSEGRNKFCQTVQPNILDCFSYKLPHHT
ncbi:MAG: hypothetical protein A3F48_00430 [Candidatus Yanofskybacteria bacterium RIFCSPHIGHO2_12_FULL_41_9]|nr:MAG: hypothetical protein A3F48_00430 [Candidatus Yanofskybacteria bacterium RIFCSPHIGHO2_12_FULL_41_9]